MMSAAIGKNRHAPALRSVPPALALGPDHPMHYALLPTNGLNHKTETRFRATAILATKYHRIRTMTRRAPLTGKQIATFQLNFGLRRRASLRRNAAISQREIGQRRLSDSGDDRAQVVPCFTSP